MKEVVAPRAEPLEAVDLAGTPLTLDDEGEGIGGEARRMGRAGRSVDDRALVQNRHILLTIVRAVMQVHGAFDLVHQFVAGIDVKLAAIVAALGDER